MSKVANDLKDLASNEKGTVGVDFIFINNLQLHRLLKIFFSIGLEFDTLTPILHSQPSSNHNLHNEVGSTPMNQTPTEAVNSTMLGKQGG
jgi:hypothetical protein